MYNSISSALCALCSACLLFPRDVCLLQVFPPDLTIAISVALQNLETEPFAFQTFDCKFEIEIALKQHRICIATYVFSEG